MNILQLCSDWKWTGSAEPMLLLQLALRSRGEEALLGCPEAPAAAEDGLARRARARGLAPDLSLGRGRGIRWLGDRPDSLRLRRFLDDRDVEVIHTWHTRDHALALRAAAVRRRAGRTVVIRSAASAEAIARTPWNRWLFGPGSDGLLCVSPEAAARNAGLRGGRPLVGALGAVDIGRFEGAAPPSPALRKALGLRASGPVIGVVARVQRHRRFDLLLAAMQRLVHTHPQAQLLVVGRGTHIDEVARQPTIRLGLQGNVVFAGQRGADYPQVLRSIDVLTYLVPGSDGSCRAVLEAAACGIPAVVSRRGALREVVIEGQTGLVVDEDPDALALSWARLLDDEGMRRRLGAEARQRARKLFVPERLAGEVLGLYRRTLEDRVARRS